MRCCDQVVYVEQRVGARNNVIRVDWIHVVNQDPTVDLVPIYTKITTVVADNNFVSKIAPLSRRVESLVQIAIKAERADPDMATQRQITKALSEVLDATKLSVCPKDRHRHRPEKARVHRTHA